MRIILDTQAFIWFVENDKKLPKKIKDLIENPINSILVSIASLWEMTIKISLCKLHLKKSLEEMLNKIPENGFELFPITPIHLISLSTLEFYHGDPFDRIIISQALSENISIVTSDNKFDFYKVKRLWK
ncbi:MAG: type toxin-antitoxin system VapC family toxin [Ignavibacteria bacterium]|nr:type toxin-antitoxin system VapC family toxin [Ignavibacteria bacterium]